MLRAQSRAHNELRPIKITPNYTKYAEGSVLLELGATKVLCNVSISRSLPKFLQNSNQGWLTAEYGMLPRATQTRTDREAVLGKQSGRSQEIQRLIGRVLRNTINLGQFPDYTFKVDCDVLQADGGTRTAAITGASLALKQAVEFMYQNKIITVPASFTPITAVSVGLVANNMLVDLDYSEDSKAEADINVVMNDQGAFLEIQGGAEGRALSAFELDSMLKLAATANQSLLDQLYPHG